MFTFLEYLTGKKFAAIFIALILDISFSFMLNGKTSLPQ